jgi:hypothetical protein
MKRYWFIATMATFGLFAAHQVGKRGLNEAKSQLVTAEASAHQCWVSNQDHKQTIDWYIDEIKHLETRVDILTRFVHEDCKACLREVKLCP